MSVHPKIGTDHGVRTSPASDRFIQQGSAPAAFAKGHAWRLAAEAALPAGNPVSAPAFDLLRRRSRHRISPGALKCLEVVGLFTIVMLAGALTAAVTNGFEGKEWLTTSGWPSYAAATALSYVLIRSIRAPGLRGSTDRKLFFFCRCSDRFLAALGAALLFAVAYGKTQTISVVWLVLFAGVGLVATLLGEALYWFARRTALSRDATLGRRRALIGNSQTITANSEQLGQASLENQWEATLAYNRLEANTPLDEADMRLVENFEREVRTKDIEEFFILKDQLPPAFLDYLMTRLARRACRFHFIFAKPLEELSVEGTVYGLNVKIGTSRCTLTTHDLNHDDVPAKHALESCTLTTYALRGHEMFAKRALDVTAALVGLTLFAPLLALAWIAIKLDSKGPFFFRQSRGGFNQADFLIWKLRTMTTAENGGEVQQAQRDDPRITRVGGILRKYNIDELPQLINVLKGEMSLVGPRPHALIHDMAFVDAAENYADRFRVLPGITGWAQINGFRGSIVSSADLERRVAHDLEYMRNWSLSLDLYILVMTIVSRRAYQNAF